MTRKRGFLRAVSLVVGFALLSVVEPSSADEKNIGWLISNDNYGSDEARCFQAAAEVAYADLEKSSWNFWLSPPFEPTSEIITEKSASPSELEKFKKLFEAGVRKFVGPSVLGQPAVFDEVRRDTERYKDVEFYPPLPLKRSTGGAEEEEGRVSVRTSVPRWDEHLAALLVKFTQYSAQAAPGVAFSVIPVVGMAEPRHVAELNSTWRDLVGAANLTSRSSLRVLGPVSFAEKPNDLLLALREAIELGSQPHIVVLDAEMVAVVRFLATHIRPRLRKSSIHVHAAAAMNYQGEVSTILENLDNVILHTAEYIGSNWHTAPRRQLFTKLRGMISEKDYGHVHCPPSTAFVYDAFMAAAGELSTESSDSNNSSYGSSMPVIVQAFYQPESLSEKSEPLIHALQDSPWIWDGPASQDKNLAEAAAESHVQFPTEPSAEIIPKPAIKAIFRNQFGRGCLDTEVAFSAYDPWQFHLVQEAYTIPGLPYMTILANIWGFWIDLKCFNDTSVSVFTLACGPKGKKPVPIPESGGDATLLGWNHCTEKRSVEDVPSERPGTIVDPNWVSKQARLLKDLELAVPAQTAHLLRRTKRHDLYSYSWLYEILHRQPGQIAPILAEIAPNIMSCFGVLIGCMTCVLLRNVFDKTGIGCMVPCASNAGHACGNAWGAFLSNHLKSRSVICTELYQQGRLDTETFIADASFGAALEQKDPLALEGYRILAGPLVTAAQKSTSFANVLQISAYPWMEYMKYEQGLPVSSLSAVRLGRAVTVLGKPVCRLVAMVSNSAAYLWSYAFF